MDAQVMDPRLQRGAALAKTKGTEIKAIAGSKYVVPSATRRDQAYICDPVEESCDCPDWLSVTAAAPGVDGQVDRPHHRCKHLYALLIVRHELVLPDGTMLVTEEKVHLKCPRDWAIENAYLVDLHKTGPLLIADLARGIPLEPPSGKRGQPRVQTRHLVYAALIKTFEMKPARDTSAYVDLHATKLRDKYGIADVCGDDEDDIMHYNTLIKACGQQSLMPLLHQLLGVSVAPLVAVENKVGQYAIDSTGFSTSVYDEWHEHKHGSPSAKASKRANFVKMHALGGTDSHGIFALQPTHRNVADCPLLKELLARAIRNGADPRELSGDAGYLSGDNIGICVAKDIMPYFDFRSNTTGESSAMLYWLYHTFLANKVAYKKRYSRRSNIETVMRMLKARFGGFLRARLVNAQYVEIMLKAICHNIACVVHAIHELAIEPKLWMPKPSTVPIIGTDEEVEVLL